MRVRRIMRKLVAIALFSSACSVTRAVDLFLIEDGKARACDLKDAVGYRHVFIVGYVENPGSYFIRDPIPLYKLVELAGVKPYKDGFETDLMKVRFMEFAPSRLSVEPKTINLKRVIESERRDELWLMSGGEVVELYWLMR